MHPIRVDAVINATGSGPVTTDPLLSRLLEVGVLAGDTLGLGVDAAPDGSVLGPNGRPLPWLSTLGPPLRGLHWETTAVPEIREQAAALATRLLERGKP